MSSTSGTRGTPPLDRQDGISPLSGAVDVLLRFGALMLRSGNTAARTREWIELMARKMELDAVSVNLSLDSITANVGRAGEWTTILREIGPPGINASRIVELEQLAKTVEPNKRRATSQPGLRKSRRRRPGIPACRLRLPSALPAVVLHFSTAPRWWR